MQIMYTRSTLLKAGRSSPSRSRKDCRQEARQEGQSQMLSREGIQKIRHILKARIMMQRSELSEGREDGQTFVQHFLKAWAQTEEMSSWVCETKAKWTRQKKAEVKKSCAIKNKGKQRHIWTTLGDGEHGQTKAKIDNSCTFKHWQMKAGDNRRCTKKNMGRQRQRFRTAAQGQRQEKAEMNTGSTRKKKGQTEAEIDKG
eukprot:1159954-Pelagomonas_calceolata.AAC.7